MKKVLLGVLGVVVVALIGVGGVAATRPDTLHVERTVMVAAAPEDVFPYVNDFDRWAKWNPWQSMDPTMALTYGDKKVGPGAWYEWKSEKMGHGKMTILSSEPAKVRSELAFIEPFESKAQVTFTFVPTDATTKVVWAYDADVAFGEKVFGLFADMDTMLGSDFERGLQNLKPMVEADAQQRLELEAAKAKQAEAEAQAASVAAATPPDGQVAR